MVFFFTYARISVPTAELQSALWINEAAILQHTIVLGRMWRIFYLTATVTVGKEDRGELPEWQFGQDPKKYLAQNATRFSATAHG